MLAYTVERPDGKTQVSIIRKNMIRDLHTFPRENLILLPCGKCKGCRYDRVRSWALRCLHEASLYENNVFITLTFDEKHVSSDYSLNKSDFQKFMKRLRKFFFGGFSYIDHDNIVRWFAQTTPIRYFHCGEYGNDFSRPHHHACLFNCYFPDARRFGRYLISDVLAKLWPFGLHTIGEVNEASANYVASYVQKKIYGDAAPDHYQGRQPEYVTMSRRPGIGNDWYKKYKNDVFPHSYVVNSSGCPVTVPRYYDKQLEQNDPVVFNDIKIRRKSEAEKNELDNTIQRLLDKEKILSSRLQKNSRVFEMKGRS